jgi:hypothetical protein
MKVHWSCLHSAILETHRLLRLRHVEGRGCLAGIVDDEVVDVIVVDDVCDVSNLRFPRSTAFLHEAV